MHSYKLIAGLQHAAPDNPNPLLIRVGERGGHGSGKPTDQWCVARILTLDRLGSNVRICQPGGIYR